MNISRIESRRAWQVMEGIKAALGGIPKHLFDAMSEDSVEAEAQFNEYRVNVETQNQQTTPIG